MEETDLFSGCCGSETAAGQSFFVLSAASSSFMSAKHLPPFLKSSKNTTDPFFA